MKNRSIKKEFEILSQEYLMLLGEKARRSESNKKIEEEYGTMDMFYEGVRAFVNAYEDEIHVLKLALINERVIGKILMSENKEILRYHLVNSTDNDWLDLINKSNFAEIAKLKSGGKIGKVEWKNPKKPTKDEFSKIKERVKNGATLADVCIHFALNKQQVIELADAK